MSILNTFKKYKDYILTENGYQLSSRWTKSDAVVMGDGTDDTNTLEKNLGSIQGITDSLTATSSNIALSAKGASDMYNEINSNLNIRYNPETDFIQVLFNDAWVNVLKAYLQQTNLYLNGIVNTDISPMDFYAICAWNNVTSNCYWYNTYAEVITSLSSSNLAAGSGQYIRCVDKIDLTNVNNITAVLDLTQLSSGIYEFIYLQVLDSLATSYVHVISPIAQKSTARLESIQNNIVVDLDVSNLTGEYYINLAINVGQASQVSGTATNRLKHLYLT